MSLSSDVETPGLGAILRTALDAVVVMRLDGTVAGWNDVAYRTFGWTFEETVGRRMSDLIVPPQYRAAHEQGLAHFLTTGEAPVLDTRLELDALHRDGHEFPVELSITRTVSSGEPVFLGFLRNITERRAAEQRQALVVGELNHRVKNLLGVVSAIAHQTMRASPTMEAFEKAFLGRLQSLGRAHEILSDATSERASLRQLVGSLLSTFENARDTRVTVDGPDLLLSPRQFLSVSMIIHELTTNAVKYGALSSEQGRIALSWRSDGRTLRLDWREDLGGPVSPPSKTGFGSKMIDLSVRNELRGRSCTSWTSTGLHFELAFDMQ